MLYLLIDLRRWLTYEKKKITYMRQIKQQNDTLYFIINWPYYVTAYSNLQHWLEKPLQFLSLNYLPN